MFRYRSGTSLEGFCTPASGLPNYSTAVKASATSYHACRSACESEILPLNLGNVYRGLSLSGSGCSCHFDTSVIVPATGWVASNPGTGGSQQVSVAVTLDGQAQTICLRVHTHDPKYFWSIFHSSMSKAILVTKLVGA